MQKESYQGNRENKRGSEKEVETFLSQEPVTLAGVSGQGYQRDVGRRKRTRPR
jgi:hypothetical protein